MANEAIVKQKLRQLLKTADMEKETQRSLTRRLEEELAVSLSQYKPMIKEEIDNYLSEQQDALDDLEDFDEEEAEPAAPAAKKQRAEGGGAAPMLPAGDDAVLQVALGNRRFARVRRYNGRLMVDVREFYEKDGALQPGARGLAMQPPAWSTLSQQLGAVDEALERQDDSFFLDLGSNKRASISSFKGKWSVDLREYYEKEGSMLPTKKGVGLSADEWGKLCGAAPKISEALGTSGSAPAQQTAAGGAGGAAAPAAAAAAAAAGGDGGGSGVGGVELSSSRRADVSVWQGKTFVNIREYYEKGGQKLPGKKGISLTPDQWAVLRQHAQQLDEALHSRNTGFELQLSAKRKASVSEFKNRYMVNIREYYEKDGQLLPGQKGISLPEDQWAKLLAGLPQLQAALEAGK